MSCSDSHTGGKYLIFNIMGVPLSSLRAGHFYYIFLIFLFEKSKIGAANYNINILNQ